MGFQESVSGEEKSRQAPALLAGVLVVGLIVGIVVLVSSHGAKKQQAAVVAQKLPFGPAEQAYAERIHITNIHLAHANNFLNQQFTYVAGTLANDGTRAITGLEITVEFHDPFKQVILRDEEPLITAQTGPLPAGQPTDFQVTLDRSLPDTWDHQYPAIRVTGLILQ
jgi:hypothetical protein